MKKNLMITLLLTAATMVLAAPQTTCPVMKGNKVNPKLYVDADGHRIYVCCKPCVAKVKANPQKYITEMKANGIDPEKVPKK